MVIGHGVDVQDIARVRKLLSFEEEDFLLGTYTQAEREIEFLQHERAEFFAGRLAAKEAVAKALGTGFAGDISWQQVEILRRDGGQPEARLKGAALVVAEKLGITRWLISISHTDAVAFASAIAIQD
jgi:holo-[acyl-carrier protein] synthase